MRQTDSEMGEKALFQGKTEPLQEVSQTTGNVPAQKRIYWIDIAKGFCMLAVIAGHLGVVPVNRVVFAFHLTVFFLLSGYTMRIRCVDKKFIQKRFCAYMKPYFFTWFAVLLGDMINRLTIEGDPSIAGISNVVVSDFARGFFASGSVCAFGPMDLPGFIGAIWFLPALFFATLFVQWVLFRTQDTKKRWSIVLIAAFAAAVLGQFVWLPFSFLAGMMASAFVLLGYYLRSWKIMEKMDGKAAVVCGMIFALGIAMGYSMIDFVTADMDDYLISSIVGIAASLLVLWLSKLRRRSRIMEFIGRNSLLYLCVHLVGLDVLPVWYDTFLLPLMPGRAAYAGALFLIKVVLISLIVIFIRKAVCLIGQKCKNDCQHPETDLDYHRNTAFAILIVAVVCTCHEQNTVLQNFVYSCALVFGVLLSGLRYQKTDIRKRLLQEGKNLLLPYSCFALGVLILYVRRGAQLESRLKEIILGMSSSENILTGIPSVGLAYFFLLLFCTKLLYEEMRKRFQGKRLSLAVLLISLLGFFLGKYGWWLPWSLDLAMYSVLFYHVGYLLRYYHVLRNLQENAALYFVMVLTVGFMIYYSTVAIEQREVGDYLVAAAGCTAAFLLLLQFCFYLDNQCRFAVFSRIMQVIGENASYILVVYSLAHHRMLQTSYQLLGKDTVYALLFSALAEIVCGIMLGITIQYLRRRLSRIRVMEESRAFIG